MNEILEETMLNRAARFFYYFYFFCTPAEGVRARTSF